MNPESDSSPEDSKARSQLPPAQQAGEQAGDWIDRYRLMQVVGEGGMGSVWMAEQSEPVRRRVALKIIKLGMDTREVVARFEAERQALALMDHPHIAKVLDGGSTTAGRPYFVMELVKGVPITKFCDEAKMGVRARLELFIDVCHAIQHAHQKGLIHRDIKPSNVLVALQDGVPTPKVIDFGIAKATTAELTQASVFTELGQLIGTPEYMAPEQAGTDGLDIDTRADVYALGILLYELLTGTKALDMREALSHGFEELLRMIREVDPQKPSTRISSLGDDSTLVADQRRTDSMRLGRNLRGDLDVIVMKAIEKERSRRYDTANEFAADVGRFLRGEPVAAVPPSFGYRAGKFIRRRKKLVAASALVGFLVLAGAVGTGIGWWRTSRANKLLDAAVFEAEENARHLQRVVDYQDSQLAGVDVPSLGARLKSQLMGAIAESQREAAGPVLAGVNFTDLALDAIEQGVLVGSADAIDGRFQEQPLVQAQLLQTLGNTCFTLGLYEKAALHQERALTIRRAKLGPEHPDTLNSLVDRGISLTHGGSLEEAQGVLEAALETNRRVFGDVHVQTASAVQALGELHLDMGDYATTQTYFEESVALQREVHGSDSQQVAAAINALGGLHVLAGRLDEAEPLLLESLELHEELYPDDHPDRLAALSTYGFLRRSQGRLDEAEVAYEDSLAGYRRQRGDAHPETLTARENLAYLQYERGQLDEAAATFGEIGEGYMELFGESHPLTLKALGDHAAVCQVAGQLDVSVKATRRILGIWRRDFGDKHVQTLVQINNLSHVLYDLGEQAEALDLAREYKAGILEVLPDDLDRLANCHYHLGKVELAAGDPVAAEMEFRGLIALREQLGKAQDWRAPNLESCVGATLTAQGRFAEAEAQLLPATEALLAREDLPPLESRQGDVGGVAIKRVQTLYQAWIEAEPDARLQAELERWTQRRADWEVR